MDSIEQLKNMLYLNRFEVGSFHWVHVTHINNPQSFYVRLTAYDMYINKIEMRGELLKTEQANIGELIIYESQTIGSYVRGRIWSIYEDVFDVFAVDYGCVDNYVPLEKMHCLFYKNQIPGLVTYCQLANCKPFEGAGWSQETIDTMKFYVGTGPAKMIVISKTPNQLSVDLINSCPDDIATLMALTGYSTFGYDQNVLCPMSTPHEMHHNHYYKYKKLNVGDLMQVRVLHRHKFLKEFYVTQIDDFKCFSERNDFSLYASLQNKLSPDEVKIGMPVTVKSYDDLKYKRCLVKEISLSNNKANVQLVDLGYTMEVSLSEIRPIHDETYFSIPATAIYCICNEYDLKCKKMYKLVRPGNNLMIRVRKAGEGFEIPYIVDIIT